VHRNSWLIFERYAASFIAPGSKVLEIGPDGAPSTYRRCVKVELEVWDTLDMTVELTGEDHLTYHATHPYEFPVPDDSYDVVLSGQVLEHVPKIWRWMPELARVTRPGGTVITIAPVTWPYHEAPQDCWRAYPDGLRALYDDAGLDVELAEWGSVELEPMLARLPRGLRRKSLWQKLSTSVLLLHHNTPLSMQGAFDTVIVGRKPVLGEAPSDSAPASAAAS
jgi:SAM-dependent methyltransferase